MNQLTKFLAGTLFTCFISGASAQETILPSKSTDEKGKFALGIFGEYARYEKALPLSVQGDYLRNNWMGTVILSFNPHEYNHSDLFSTYKVNSFYSRISVLGGLRLTRDKNLEITGGYTLRTTLIKSDYNAPGLYMERIKGTVFDHYVTVNIGYKFMLGKKFFIKPEMSFNYRLDKNVMYDYREVDSPTGQTIYSPIAPVNKFMNNFQPQLRLGIGFMLGK